jgi:nicotinamidase-related amidase
VTSEPMRDPTTDHLLTPRNSALIIIDYQPLQVSSVASMDRRELVMNIMAVTRLAKLFRLPIVLSTVNVKAKGSKSARFTSFEICCRTHLSSTARPLTLGRTRNS